VNRFWLRSRSWDNSTRTRGQEATELVLIVCAPVSEVLTGFELGQRSVDEEGKQLGQVGGGPERVADELDPVACRVRGPLDGFRVSGEPTSCASARTARVATPPALVIAIRQSWQVWLASTVAAAATPSMACPEAGCMRLR
jgi:hypothetical protein